MDAQAHPPPPLVGLLPVARAQRSACRLLRVAGPLLVTLSALGCQRKAPGPDDCVAFATAWLRFRGVAAPEQMLGRGAFDGSQGQIDPFTELVTRCLTEPYDRTLVECVVNGKNPEFCRSEFARRREAARAER